VPDQKFTGVLPTRDESKMQAQVLFPPNIYLTHRFGDSWGVGLVFDVPYASKTEWDPNWIGKRLVTKSDLRVVTFTPAVGVKISESLALGAGVQVYIPKILFEHAIPDPAAAPGTTGTADGIATYEANGGAQIGFQLGILAQPVRTVTLGASFRSRTLMNLDDGSVLYRGTADTLLPGGRFSTTLLSPPSVQAGIAWDPVEWLHAEVDGEYTFWSGLKTVDVYYVEPVAPGISYAQNWDNTLNLRAGLEITFSDVSIRGGMRVERTPVPDGVLTPGVPDANARAYSVGLGYRVGEGLLMDFAYESVQFEDRIITSSVLQHAGTGTRFNGIYASRNAAVALNVRYSWK
jgi:long-chain fatty acid transport protein